MIELLLGQIPEALYFSLFMIYGKKLGKKRILYTSLMIAQYLLLARIFPFDLWFQFSYTFLSFAILKILYKDQAQVTDIFLFLVSTMFLMIITSLSYILILYTTKELLHCYILSRILLFIFIFLIKDKINIFYKKYYNNWNRKEGLKVKALTVRNFSIIFMNLLFYIINLGILYVIYTR